MAGKGTRLAVCAAGTVAAVLVALGSAGAREDGHRLPDPGGSRNALVPVPPPGKHFGFNDHSFLNKRRFIPADTVAARAKAAGADVFRYEVAWKLVEPARDHWDERVWDAYKGIDRALNRLGIRSIVILGSTPQWARQRGAASDCQAAFGCEYPPAADDLDHFGEFAAEVARRLKNPIIETWNEPNLALFFKPRPDPGRYARMHLAAYRAIKRARPRTRVLLAGNANTRRTDRVGGKIIRYSQRGFLSRIYPKVKGRFNGISLHPYPSSPAESGRSSMISRAVHDARVVQRRFNDRGNDLWVTETGFSTTGPGAVSPAGQAKGLLATYRQLATMADVRAVVVHTLYDQTEVSRGSRGYGFGLIHDETPLKLKPAFCSFNGRSGVKLLGRCKRSHDRSAPGAKRNREFRRICLGWLRPQASYQRGTKSRRARKLDRCLLDLWTLESAKAGRVASIRHRVAVRTRSPNGARPSARGRAGIAMARRAVRRLARAGYL